jgi:hypothetical protein
VVTSKARQRSPPAEAPHAAGTLANPETPEATDARVVVLRNARRFMSTSSQGMAPSYGIYETGTTIRVCGILDGYKS